jgi:hypothetical protein
VGLLQLGLLQAQDLGGRRGGSGAGASLGGRDSGPAGGRAAVKRVCKKGSAGVWGQPARRRELPTARAWAAAALSERRCSRQAAGGNPCAPVRPRPTARLRPGASRPPALCLPASSRRPCPVARGRGPRRGGQQWSGAGVGRPRAQDPPRQSSGGSLAQPPARRTPPPAAPAAPPAATACRWSETARRCQSRPWLASVTDTLVIARMLQSRRGTAGGAGTGNTSDMDTGWMLPPLPSHLFQQRPKPRHVPGHHAQPGVGEGRQPQGRCVQWAWRGRGEGVVGCPGPGEAGGGMGRISGGGHEEASCAGITRRRLPPEARPPHLAAPCCCRRCRAWPGRPPRRAPRRAPPRWRTGRRGRGAGAGARAGARRASARGEARV